MCDVVLFQVGQQLFMAKRGTIVLLLKTPNNAHLPAVSCKLIGVENTMPIRLRFLNGVFRFAYKFRLDGHLILSVSDVYTLNVRRRKLLSVPRNASAVSRNFEILYH